MNPVYMNRCCSSFFMDVWYYIRYDCFSFFMIMNFHWHVRFILFFVLLFFFLLCCIVYQMSRPATSIRVQRITHGVKSVLYVVRYSSLEIFLVVKGTQCSPSYAINHHIASAYVPSDIAHFCHRWRARCIIFVGRIVVFYQVQCLVHKMHPYFISFKMDAFYFQMEPSLWLICLFKCVVSYINRSW